MSLSSEKFDIRQLKMEEINQFVTSNNESAFRAKQVFEWLWKKGVASFAEMNNLSQTLRQLLEQSFCIHQAKIEKTQNSKDKTIKIAFRLFDQELVEGVLIPSEKRATACISTQSGCPLGCKFCATGFLGFKRNLTAGEIYDQVLLIKKLASEQYNLPLTNIVIMGMGEPLLNYENVMQAIHFMTSKDGLEMSPDRITMSTAGIPKMIKKLADDKIKFNLSISLHSANDIKRSSIMPVNVQNNLQALTDALKYFHKYTGIRITIEYLLLHNFNDSLNDAKELAIFCKSFPVKINIIEYNSVDISVFQKSSDENLKSFTAYLESKNLIVNVRRSRGKDIDAACGQLACKN